MSTGVGRKIRTIREALEMGRAEFSEKTGIPKGSLIQVEQEIREPKAGVLEAIAKQWPEFAAYLLTDEVEIKQRNPETEKLARELPEGKTDCA